jgi:hypothetical protein
MQIIEANKLQEAYSRKPHIDGTYVIKTLGKKGQAIGIILSNS